MPLVLVQHLVTGNYSYFYSPPDYQLLSLSNLTPWITFSIGLDVDLWGFDPATFRIRNLVSYLVFVVVVFWVLIRNTGSVLVTSLFTIAVSLSPAVLSVMASTITRHYMEGIVFALSSFALFQIYLENNRWLALCGSVLVFALALTAKETFAPLPALLFFLGDRSLRTRILDSLPFGVVCLCYLAWRVHMIGGFGGYFSLDSVSLSDAFLYLFPKLLVGKWLSLAVTVFVVFMLSSSAGVLKLREWLAVLVCYVCLMLPLYFVVPGIMIIDQPRWGMAPDVATLLFVALLAARVKNVFHKVAACAIALSTIAASAQAGLLYKPQINMLTLSPMPSLMLKSSEYAAINIATKNDDLWFRSLIIPSVVHWSFLGRLLGAESTLLPVFYVPQLHIHNIAGDEISPAEWKAMEYRPQEQLGATDLELSLSVSEQGSKMRILPFENTGVSDCFLYLYTDDSGIPLPLESCGLTTLDSSELMRHSRVMDFSEEALHLVVWGLDDQGRYLLTRPLHIGLVGKIDFAGLSTEALSTPVQ